jgi:vitamin K-dependent gamma-carboxylase-like protein
MSAEPSRWQRFWFEPQETSSLALFRIGFGLLVFAWTATLLPNLSAFYGPHGIMPRFPRTTPGEWSLLNLSNSPVLLWTVFVTTLVAALALTVGFHTRIAAVVVWIGIVSIEQRNGQMTNSGDGVVRSLAFLLALSPAGAALSLDRLRSARGRFWEFPARAPWALRLIQLQISIGYLFAVTGKFATDRWTDGTAVAYALRIDDVRRLATPAFITQSATITGLLTYGTLIIELSLAVLIWIPRLRPFVLVLGVVLHVGIDSSILVGFFSYAMLISYLCFIPPHTTARWVLATRDAAIGLARARTRGRLPPPTAPESSTNQA